MSHNPPDNRPPIVSVRTGPATIGVPVNNNKTFRINSTHEEHPFDYLAIPRDEVGSFGKPFLIKGSSQWTAMAAADKFTSQPSEGGWLIISTRNVADMHMVEETEVTRRASLR